MSRLLCSLPMRKESRRVHVFPHCFLRLAALDAARSSWDSHCDGRSGGGNKLASPLLFTLLCPDTPRRRDAWQNSLMPLPGTLRLECPICTAVAIQFVVVQVSHLPHWNLPIHNLGPTCIMFGFPRPPLSR